MIIALRTQDLKVNFVVQIVYILSLNRNLNERYCNIDPYSHKIIFKAERKIFLVQPPTVFKAWVWLKDSKIRADIIVIGHRHGLLFKFGLDHC